MKIRDLVKYVEIISGDPNWRGKIGIEGDPFYSKLFGEDFNLEYYVGHISDFAENSNEQIFYELIQNASDAGASSFFVGFDEENFVVLNNGEPFISDGEKAKNSKSRLRSFLTKNKGPKAGESDSIGKHGQGSKLLYDLIIPVASSVSEGSTNKEDLLQKAIISKKKGPILYSWDNVPLQRFLNWNFESFVPEDHNDTSIPLLTKLIYSYFPAYPERAPGSWFSYEDLEKCVTFLNKISSQININDFFSGTLIYIPLGEGRFEELTEILGGNLISGIRTSLALLPNIDRVIINNEPPIERPQDFKNILIREVENEKSEILKTRLFLPEIPEELDHNLSNFFQYFPISSEIYGLKFIIDSQEYAIKGSRQSIDLSDGHNKKTIKEISESIINYYSGLVSDRNIEEAIHFVKCILGSGEGFSNNSKEKERQIKKYFYDDIIEILKDHLPTYDDQFLNIGSVRVKKSNIPVDPNRIGQDQIHWLNEGLKDFYEKINDHLKVEKWTISDIINSCSNDEIRRDFIYELTDNEYNTLLIEFHVIFNQVSIKFQKFLKSSFENLYSINDILNNEDIILAESRISSLGNIFIRHDIDYAGEQLLKYPWLMSKVEKEYHLRDIDLVERIQILVGDKNLLRDEKWKLFKTYESFQGVQRNYLRNTIRLFSNKQNIRVPFNKLLPDNFKYANSSILNIYQINPIENYFTEFATYYMNEGEIWKNVYEDWQLISDTLDDSNYQVVLQDLQRIFDLGDNPSEFEDDVDWILTDDGEWITSDDFFYNPKLNDLKKEDYDELKILVKSISTFKMVDFQYLEIFSEGSFFHLPPKSLRDLSERLNQNSYQLTKRQIKLLNSIRVNKEGFFISFYITEGSELYHLTKNDKPKKKQYFSLDRVLNEFLVTTGTYKLLPSELTDIFKNDNSLRTETEEFINTLIEEFGTEKALVYAVKRQGQNVKENYLYRCQRIDLYSSDQRPRYAGEFEGEVIQFIVQLRKKEEFREKIFVDGIALNEIAHENQVRVNYPDESNIIYFRLSDLRDESDGSGLEVVKSKLAGVNYGSLFTLDEYSQVELYDELLEEDEPFSEEQIAFLIAYDQVERGDLNSNHQYIFNDVEDIPLLNKFFEKGIDKFEKYLPDHFFHPSRHIYSSELELLMHEEILPQKVTSWINQGDLKNKMLFLEKNGLEGVNSPILKVRNDLRKITSLKSSDISKATWNKNLANNTLRWIDEKLSDKLIYGKEVYRGTLRLILEFVKYHDTLPVKLLQIYPGLDDGIIFGKLLDWAEYEDLYYLAKINTDDSSKLFLASEKLELKLIDASYRGFKENLFETLENNNILNASLKSEILPQEFEKRKEWDIDFYKTWLTEIDYSIRIYLLEEEIPFKYEFHYGNEIAEFRDTFNEKSALIKEPKANDLNVILINESDTTSILEHLSEKQDDLFKGKHVELIKLLNLARLSSDDRKLVETIKENKIGSDHISVLGTALKKNGFSPEQLKNLLNKREKNGGKDGVDLGKEISKSELKKLRTSIDDVNSLLSQIDPEQLKLLVENIDSFKQLLETEDEESKPNQIIGHIGEVLMVEWLKLKPNDSQPKVDHVSVIRDLRSGVKPTYKSYDIQVQYRNAPYYLDVKTTIKSLKNLSKSFAFFISRKEYEYIEKENLGNYFISRISLQDLGLKFIYDKIKREYAGLTLKEIPKEVDDYIIKECRDFLLYNDGLRKIEEHRFIFEVSIPKGSVDSPF
ncbi:MAG: hypothetical protein DWQ02_01170 [Bacteroidetes bacterium]|nr:MAG: hypothetical protein DWQ02_01170 [Bacteroidota bacterium]